jgi:hypothetical protein
MSRYYSVQVHSDIAGWQDIPGLASKKEKEAIQFSKEYLDHPLKKGTHTRVIRKPKGWEPFQKEWTLEEKKEVLDRFWEACEEDSVTCSDCQSFLSKEGYCHYCDKYCSLFLMGRD